MNKKQSPLLESIKKTSFFDVFSEEEKWRFVEKGGRLFKRYEQKGLTIFSEGDKGDSMFVVLSGAINIAKLVAPNNQEKNASLSKSKHTVIAKMEAGSVFGEVAMLSGQTRTTYAITDTPLVVVMEINQEILYSFNLAIQHKFDKQLISTLIGRLNTINKKFANLKEENSKNITTILKMRAKYEES
ncbi:MAG: cyclic nucleotide-binding domain-containing protein [Nitrospinota bacterium]|nr:cyclic nucleotide-binding domain-containing protein [Nitrospinota bacterium]